MGIDGADGPRDVARNKHSYLAEAYTRDHTVVHWLQDVT